MWRAISLVVALTFAGPATAGAQAPCTTDARQVVDELYRNILERQADAGASGFVDQVANGRATVRDIVRQLATSAEHNQRFVKQEVGEEVPFVRAVGTLYRHLLGRQPDDNGARAYAGMAQRQGITAVIDSILNSQEYQQKYGNYGVPGSGGVTFCGPGQSSSVSQGDRNMRFRNMDTNSDGVISLSEWRGTRQAFNVNDWNGDGVLSGEEVRVNGRRNRDVADDGNWADRFERLDTNNNSRIEESEWPGTLAAFDRLDRNNDGLISQAEMANASQAGTSGTSSSFEYLDRNNNGRIEESEWRGTLAEFDRHDRNNDGVLSRAEWAYSSETGAVGTSGAQFTVPAGQEWTDTGLNVRAGDTLTFDAEGTVRLTSGRGDIATPAGAVSGRRAPDAPIANAAAGSLVARVGNSRPIWIGQRRTIRAPVSGTLYLGVNDDYVQDNSGSFRVNVDVAQR